MSQFLQVMFTNQNAKIINVSQFFDQNRFENFEAEHVTNAVVVVVILFFLFDLTLASKIDLVETNLNRIFKLLTVYVYIICIFQC